MKGVRSWNYFGMSAATILKELGIEPSPENVSRLERKIPNPKDYAYGGHNVALGMSLERQFRAKVKELFL